MVVIFILSHQAKKLLLANILNYVGGLKILNFR